MPPLPAHTERAEQLARELREHVRRRRHRWLAQMLGILASLGAALFLMGWAIATTNERWAAVAFWGGFTVGYAGSLLTLVVPHVRAIERGEL